MNTMNPDDFPVQETTINDLFAEDIERIEVMGEHARLVFWRWKFEGGKWVRVTLDWSVVLPLRGLPLDSWPSVRVVRPPHCRSHPDRARVN